jgi:hypothetical protein
MNATVLRSRTPTDGRRLDLHKSGADNFVLTRCPTGALQAAAARQSAAAVLLSGTRERLAATCGDQVETPVTIARAIPPQAGGRPTPWHTACSIVCAPQLPGNPRSRKMFILMIGLAAAIVATLGVAMLRRDPAMKPALVSRPRGGRLHR